MPRQIQRSYRCAALVLTCFTASSARAATNCASAASLRAQVRDCAGNLAYGMAAKDCVDRFTQEVDSAQKTLADALASSSADKQRQSETSAKGSFAKAMSALASLASSGVVLQRQVKGYKTEVAWPEDFAEATKAGIRGEDMLRKYPCYTDTQKILDNYAAIFGARVDQLRLTKTIAAGLHDRALKNEIQLSPDEALRQLQQTKGQGTGSGVKNGQGGSDITGVRQDKQKQQK